MSSHNRMDAGKHIYIYEYIGYRATYTDQFGYVVAEDRRAIHRPRQRQRWRHVHDIILLSSPVLPPSSPASTRYTDHCYFQFVFFFKRSIFRWSLQIRRDARPVAQRIALKLSRNALYMLCQNCRNAPETSQLSGSCSSWVVDTLHWRPLQATVTSQVNAASSSQRMGNK